MQVFGNHERERIFAGVAFLKVLHIVRLEIVPGLFRRVVAIASVENLAA